MRVMVMIKGSGADEDKIAPTDEMFEVMNAYNEELVNAGIMLDGEGLKPSSAGREGRVRGRYDLGGRRAVHRGQGDHRRLLDLAGQLARRSRRVGQAVPDRPEARRRRSWRSGRSSRWRTSARSSRRRSREQEQGSSSRSTAQRRRAGMDRRGRHRRGDLADRVAAAHRLAHPPGPGRRAGRGARAGRVRRRRSSSGRRPGVPDNPARLADGDRQAPGDRPDPARAEPGRQVRGARARAHRRGGRTRRRRQPSATTCSPSSSSRATRCCRASRGSR